MRQVAGLLRRWVVNAKMDSSFGVAAAMACVFVGGLTASVAGPNIKCACYIPPLPLLNASPGVPCSLPAAPVTCAVVARKSLTWSLSDEAGQHVPVDVPRPPATFLSL